LAWTKRLGSSAAASCPLGTDSATGASRCPDADRDLGRHCCNILTRTLSALFGSHCTVDSSAHPSARLLAGGAHKPLHPGSSGWAALSLPIRRGAAPPSDGRRT